MPLPKVAFDSDGVLMETYEIMWQLYVENFGSASGAAGPFRRDDFPTLESFNARIYAGDAERVRQKDTVFLGDPDDTTHKLAGIFLEAPIAGSVDGVAEIEWEAEPYVLTSGFSWLCPRKAKWYGIHFPNIPPRNYIFSDNKAQACIEHSINVAVEDRYDYALAMGNVGTHVVLINRYSWSEVPTGGEHPLIHVVPNWFTGAAMVLAILTELGY